jgi:hypothetical protein
MTGQRSARWLSQSKTDEPKRLMEPLGSRDPAFIGPYRLLARLGEGGMGRVYLGMSAGGRVVAVKVIHADHARDAEFRERFKVEVAAARKVQAAFTAPVIDAGEDDDPPWLVTSLVEGPSLADVIKSQGPLPSDAVWRLVAGLAEALAAVHAGGIVHRDVTPGNVLLAIDGPRLIDFGLARALGASNMTATGIVIGTPAFLSPEHVRGNQVGPASDIFSLGSLMVFAATGAGPFGSGDPIEVIGRIAGGEPDFRGLGGPLREVAAACLGAEPAGRPAPAEIIRSVPDDSAGRPDRPATQFWPAPLDAFIRSYQARFAVVRPSPRSTGQQSPVPFKPPKDIAAEAVSLAQRGQGDDARQLLATAAVVRPDQEVVALIALLRADGRHAEAEVVVKSAARRPGREVAALAGMLKQLGSDADADNLLDQAADGSAEHVGSIVTALAGAGRTREMHRLLRGAAAAAARQPQDIVTLVGVLSSAGLGRDVAWLVDRVAAVVSPVQAAALGDAMRRSGHGEAALRLYSAAVGAVAGWPPPEVASAAAFMRDADQGDLANRLIEALVVASRETGETAGIVALAAALSAVGLDADARRVLAVVPAVTPLAGVIEIAGSLLAMGHQEAALSVCAEAADKDPAAAGPLADALRDMGRPVDAYRLLESLGTRTVGQAGEVIAGLRAASRSDDADRVLRAFLRRHPELTSDLVARLGQLGASEDGSRIAALLDPNSQDLISELARSFIKRQDYGVADHLLARAAQGSAPECCDLIDRALRPPPGKSRPPAHGSFFPGPEPRNSPRRRPASGPVMPVMPVRQGHDLDLFALHWQAHYDHGGLVRRLRNLRGEHLGVAAHELLSHVAGMPPAEVLRFARELEWVDGAGAGRPVPVFWPRASEAAALIATTARRAPADVGAVIQALLDRPEPTAPGRLRLAATELLAAITAYPDEVVVTTAIGLNAVRPELLAPLARITAGFLPEIVAGNSGRDEPGARDACSALLAAAGTSLPAADFCRLYLHLRERRLSAEASLLLKAAEGNPGTPELIAELKRRGLRREARQLLRG